MENVNVCETILGKKIDGYNFEKKDFVAAGELTVTITLSEYRSLVADYATRKTYINKANSDKYERENENKRLKEEVSRLKAEIYELKTVADNSKED